MNVAQIGFKIVLGTAQMNAIDYDCLHVYFIINFDAAVIKCWFNHSLNAFSDA